MHLNFYFAGQVATYGYPLSSFLNYHRASRKDIVAIERLTGINSKPHQLAANFVVLDVYYGELVTSDKIIQRIRFVQALRTVGAERTDQLRACRTTRRFSESMD